jgi:Zn-dependent M32 family carboxypeptidase
MGEGEFIVFMESPLYLTGYFLANMTAVQIFNHMCQDGSLFNRQPETIGNYLKENFFKHGNCYPWYELRDRAIQEKPSMKNFIAHYQF